MAKRRGPHRARRSRPHKTVSNHRFDVVPLDTDGLLHGINNKLEYAGQIETEKGAARAVVVTAAGMKILGTLGGSASSARAINDTGTVVGASLTDGDEHFHAFLYDRGQMRDLNDLIAPETGWTLIQALGINARGDIIAIGTHNGTDRAVLLKKHALRRSR